jgi:hypothetical protein
MEMATLSRNFNPYPEKGDNIKLMPISLITVAKTAPQKIALNF